MPASLVSIVTRTKDRPAFLRRALRSIGAQTYANWELIIVDDGGAPGVVEAVLADAPSATRARTRVVAHATPQGRWQAANAGVREARGNLVILHDDDDSWASSFLARAVGYLDDNPQRVGVVSRIEIVWEERDGDSFIETNREPFLPNSVAPLLMDQQRFNQFVPIAFLYRRELHDALGLYDDSLSVIGDWVFNSRVLQHSALEYLDTEPLVYWHQRPSSSGVDGNSVIESSEEHRRVDALVRDQEFRALIAREGAGGALYFERRLRETEELMKREFELLRHESLHPVRSFYRRVRNRIIRRSGIG
ncbi:MULTISPECIES: glycosyltransferase family 2 protein [Microbacterium]|uniref:Glycosyltransferase family 2 protein n=1 Tax=Microbacterium galbinum TaxID=2851646 RepID=A0ABY4IUZ7_9MICO|nr:glycosyltransferase family A protein [Microbacterium galbinum]UPL15208.1 glycosyltransferase family 2 protein [Microbacterium galbinum]